MIKLFGAEFKNKKNLIGFIVWLGFVYAISKISIELIKSTCL
jgi:hypothetical protein